MLDYIKSIFSLFFQTTKWIKENIIKGTYSAL